MNQILTTYIPQDAISDVVKLLQQDSLVIKVKSERKTKHGDYKPLSNGKHQITINGNLNPYRFLMTLIHEIAHFEAFKNYGKFIKPHGKEWKHTFQHLMLPFIRPEIFPNEILPLLANHFKNPKASSDSDIHLAAALKRYDKDYDEKTYVYQLPADANFKLYNGRTFKKGPTRRKRIECTELKTGRIYLFNPNAEVELLS